MWVEHSHLPTCEDGTECFETSTYKLQTLGNYPKESIQHKGAFFGKKREFKELLISAFFNYCTYEECRSVFVVICQFPMKYEIFYLEVNKSTS